MVRGDTFTFRVNQNERELIEALASMLQRSQSDAIRFVVVNSVRELTAQEEKETQLITKKELQDGKISNPDTSNYLS